MFVTFEGLDGSGKSTLARALGDALVSEGYEVVHTREPGGTPVGTQIRELLLNQGEITNEAELFLFLADRSENIHQLVKPASEAGKIVLCDRHADSTLVYQGYGRGLDLATLRTLNSMATRGRVPDLTFLLDLEVETALKRQLERNRLGSQPVDFYDRVRAGFLAEAAREPHRWSVLEATRSTDHLVKLALATVRDRLPHQNG